MESHLLDYSGELYGHRARIEFYHFMRPEQRFESQEALAARIHADTEEVRAWFQKSFGISE